MTRTSSAVLGALTLIALSAGNALASDMKTALAKGAVRMTAEQISKRLANKTVTFENANTGAKAIAYYDGRNGVKLKLLGSNKMLKGFYATDLADHICLGIEGQAPMRLRCVSVLLIDGVMHKFELDGSLRGRVIEETDGKLI